MSAHQHKHYIYTRHSLVSQDTEKLSNRVVPDLIISNSGEPDRNSNLAGARSKFQENLFWDHRTICLMKLMALTMASAAKEAV